MWRPQVREGSRSGLCTRTVTARLLSPALSWQFPSCGRSRTPGGGPGDKCPLCPLHTAGVSSLLFPLVDLRPSPAQGEGCVGGGWDLSLPCTRGMASRDRPPPLPLPRGPTRGPLRPWPRKVVRDNRFCPGTPTSPLGGVQ